MPATVLILGIQGKTAQCLPLTGGVHLVGTQPQRVVLGGSPGFFPRTFQPPLSRLWASIFISLWSLAPAGELASAFPLALSGIPSLDSSFCLPSQKGCSCPHQGGPGWAGWTSSVFGSDTIALLPWRPSCCLCSLLVAWTFLSAGHSEIWTQG